MLLAILYYLFFKVRVFMKKGKVIGGAILCGLGILALLIVLMNAPPAGLRTAEVSFGIMVYTIVGIILLIVGMLLLIFGLKGQRRN
jgi:hypothetical protein